MTCVVGLIENGIVHMAADQGTTNEYDNVVRVGLVESKIIKRGNFLIGFSGNVLQCQEDIFKLDLSDLVGLSTLDRRKELHARFVAVRPQLSVNAYLVGHKGQLYTVWSSKCYTSQFDFIGSDTRSFNIYFQQMKNQCFSGGELASNTVLAASKFVFGVACDPEGPTVLSI